MKENILISLQNPKIKNVVKLRDRQHRNQHELMLIEGYRELMLAIDNKISLQTLFYCKKLFQSQNERLLIRRAQESGTILFEVSIQIFQKIAYRDNSDGLLAVAHQPRYSLNNLPLGKCPLLIIVEAIEKPGNLGAILRSADAAGADGVIVCDGCTDVYNPNVVRASLGTIFTMPIVESSSAETIQWLRNHNIKIVATTPYATLEYTDADLRNPCAIIMGSEKKGLSEKWMEIADLKVHIPMSGQADSLNVAMTATILLYEAVRQRKVK